MLAFRFLTLVRRLLGAPDAFRPWLREPTFLRIALLVFCVVLGSSFYGVTIGLWRGPLMGAYVGVKLPILLFATLTCNGLLNGMLGALLGGGIGFRASLLALLLSFAVASLILGSLAPVTLFLVLNLPPPGAPGAAATHAGLLLLHTTLIAFAGVVGNLHLFGLLQAETADGRRARITLFAWLAGNAFVGAQFAWILRPFFGTPHLEVQFLRDDPWSGNFYLGLWSALNRLEITLSPSLVVACVLLLPAAYFLFKPFQTQPSIPHKRHEH